MDGHNLNKRCSRLDWWKTEPLYQVYPRSFYDSNGDGVGDIAGILHKLDYFEWLGIKNVWISPVYKSPMVDFGYDVSDYQDIDPIFGNLSDFRALVAKMHSKGMKLIMDFIPNHTSIKHPWFEKSIKKVDPFSDYYVWHDGKLDKSNKERKCPNNWESVFGGPAWTWCPERKQYYLHNFLPEQPNLNHRNAQVCAQIKQIFQFWMDLGVDGFRIDAVIYLLHDSQYRDNVKDTESKGLTTISKSETFDSDHPDHYGVVGEWIEFIRDYGKKLNRHIFTMTEGYTCLSNYGKYYDVAGVDFPFNLSLSDWDRKIGVVELRQKIEDYLHSLQKDRPRAGRGRWPNFVVGNHDLPRICTRLGGEKYADVVNMLLLLLPGTPVCYYGDELGMEDVPITYGQCQDPPGKKLGPKRYMEKSRDPCRSPMLWCTDRNAGFTTCEKPWLPVGAKYHSICVERQKLDPSSHLNFFRQLLAFRQSSRSSFNSQNLHFADPILSDKGQASILAFFRTIGDHSHNEPIFLVILNFDPDVERIFFITFCNSTRFKTGRLVFKTPGYHSLPLHGLIKLDTVQLKGLQGIVLEMIESKKTKSFL